MESNQSGSGVVVRYTEAEFKEEKDRRIYYQSIVYDVCNALDRIFGYVETSGKVPCGSIEAPSKSVQIHMGRLEQYIAELKDRVKRAESTRKENCDAINSLDEERGRLLRKIKDIKDGMELKSPVEEPDPVICEKVVSEIKMPSNEKMEKLLKDSNNLMREINHILKQVVAPTVVRHPNVGMVYEDGVASSDILNHGPVHSGNFQIHPMKMEFWPTINVAVGKNQKDCPVIIPFPEDMPEGSVLTAIELFYSSHPKKKDAVQSMMSELQPSRTEVYHNKRIQLSN